MHQEYHRHQQDAAAGRLLLIGYCHNPEHEKRRRMHVHVQMVLLCNPTPTEKLLKQQGASARKEVVYIANVGTLLLEKPIFNKRYLLVGLSDK